MHSEPLVIPFIELTSRVPGQTWWEDNRLGLFVSCQLNWVKRETQGDLSPFRRVVFEEPLTHASFDPLKGSGPKIGRLRASKESRGYQACYSICILVLSAAAK